MAEQTLSGKVAIVTGGARGIGRGTARCLAEAGADVVIADLRPEGAAEEAAAGVQACGRRAVVKQVDVADRVQVERLIQETVQELGRLDIMVACAGIVIPEPFLEITPEHWERVRAVDFDAVFHCTQLAARAMVAQGQGGKIVIISSVHAEINFVGAASYDAAKAGSVMLARGAARELAAHRINVNAIGPGWIDTPLNAQWLGTAEDRQAVTATIPWGRIGQPEDIGNLATFLCSDRADYITGAYIRCDGGFILSK